jgi:hypothetical protein
MGIKDKLTTDGSVLSNLNGSTTTVPDFKGSKLHDTYSINDTPTIPGKPSPSQLDLEGKIPSYNYRDNAPEGASF